MTTLFVLDSNCKHIDWIKLFPNIVQLWSTDYILGALGGNFEQYTRYPDIPLELQAAPSRIKSNDGLKLWQWWSSPDVGCGKTPFKCLSKQYRDMVWSVLLVCEHHYGNDMDGINTLLPYGQAPIEIWMMIFGFCKRSIKVEK